MRIKSYFAATVQEAMAVATQELGHDAMLVQSRKAPIDARHLGDYEVVVATEVPSGDPETAPAVPEAPPPRSTDSTRLSLEVADLKREIENMRRTISRSVSSLPWMGASADSSDAFAALTACEMAPDLAREIVSAAEARLHANAAPNPRGRRPDSGALMRAVAEELDSRFRTEATLGRAKTNPRIVALVGPPGSGKTTTLAKLAVNYGLAARRPVQLLSVDNYRVAAADQLRAYAAILGVGFQALETVSALGQALEENRNKELIFIDTPGYGFAELELGQELAHFLAGRSDIDTHLVLPASMKPADAARFATAYEIFSPQHLLFTKLDETASYGPVFGEAARTGLPISFFTSGQRIPEDLEAAGNARLVDLILTGQLAAGRATARLA